MKNLTKIVICLSLMLFIGLKAKSQTVTIVDGISSNYYNKWLAPYGNWEYGARHQITIKASELSTAGGITGDITSIEFDVSDVNSYPALKDQSLLFHEDFEISPVTSILNSGETQLTEGPSPCSKGSRGNTTDFNSANVDFQNLQNSSYFLGVNPESPCGGFYTASLSTDDSLDLSSADSLKFKCKYFKSSTLNWGGAILNIVFDNGTTNFTIDESNFPANDNWDSLEIALPNSMIDPSVLMTINLGGGEGVGIDDIKIINIISTNINQHNFTNNIKLYPVPANNLLHIEFRHIQPNINYTIMDLYGNVITKNSIQQTSNAIINVEHLSKGIYIIKITDNTNKSAYYKIVKN